MLTLGHERTKKKITAKEKGTIERQNRSTAAESYTRRAFSARNRDTCGDRCCLDDLDGGDGRNTVARRCLAIFGTLSTFALRRAELPLSSCTLVSSNEITRRVMTRYTLQVTQRMKYV